MTTLNAIGFTTAGSSIVAMTAFCIFSCAVRSGSPKIAPRCSARSKETIYNRKAKRKRSLFFFLFRCCRRRGNMNHKKYDDEGKHKLDPRSFGNSASTDVKKNHLNQKEGTNFGSGKADYSGEEEDNMKEHVQYRGGPMFGWIPWTLSLSYETLLKGVPGTGTRKNGMEGSMLKVNLDGIVLLRFHGEFVVFTLSEQTIVILFCRIFTFSICENLIFL